MSPYSGQDRCSLLHSLMLEFELVCFENCQKRGLEGEGGLRKVRGQGSQPGLRWARTHPRVLLPASQCDTTQYQEISRSAVKTSVLADGRAKSVLREETWEGKDSVDGSEGNTHPLLTMLNTLLSALRVVKGDPDSEAFPILCLRGLAYECWRVSGEAGLAAGIRNRRLLELPPAMGGSSGESSIMTDCSADVTSDGVISGDLNLREEKLWAGLPIRTFSFAFFVERGTLLSSSSSSVEGPASSGSEHPKNCLWRKENRLLSATAASVAVTVSQPLPQADPIFFFSQMGLGQ
eukprot:Hpha_TRINITY_DN16687_c2_g10::TRINITY_DN16687_c2_g10_i1::g.182727::m.182727